MQLHRLKPHLNAISFGMLGHAAVGRKQSKLTVSLIVCVQRFDYTTPIRVLAVIDFAEYSTGRCATLPPAQRLLSTMLQ